MAHDRGLPGAVMRERLSKGSPLAFLFATVFVDMMGYGIVVPLLPFYAREHVPGAVLIGALGSLYAAAQLFGGPYLGGLSRITWDVGPCSSCACSALPAPICCSG